MLALAYDNCKLFPFPAPLNLWKKVTFFPTKVNALGGAWLCDGHPAGVDDSLPDVYAQGLLHIREQGQGIS